VTQIIMHVTIPKLVHHVLTAGRKHQETLYITGHQEVMIAHASGFQ
jgi:hypothetical protein